MVDVALDPGGKTGIVTCSDAMWSMKEIGPQEHHEQLWMELALLAPDRVVCEGFIYQQRDKVVLVSLEYIGIAKLFCRRHGVEYIEQMPNIGLSLFPDAQLKRLGLHSPGMKDANSAVRHLLYYYTVALKDDFYVRQLKPED